MRKIVVSILFGVVSSFLIIAGPVRGQIQPPPPPAPPCPPKCPTATPSPTPTVTATPSPTPTATPVPLTLTVKLAHGTVNPRSKQKVTVTTLPSATVNLTVKFPNGNTKTHSGTANASGGLSWSYVQPGSRITHSSSTVRVSVQASNGTDTKSSTKRYTIGYARLDISVEPRTQTRGHVIGIWLHTPAATPVQIVLRFANGQSQNLVANNRGAGWSYVGYTVPTTAPKGRVDVKGYNLARSYPGSAETSFRVK